MIAEEELKTLNFKKNFQLKYGENPHQKASLYKYEDEIDYNLLTEHQLTYNDILDATKALEVASEFYDVACVCAIKHEVPSVVALGNNIESAWNKAIDSDPISPLNSVVCFTKKIDLKFSQILNKIPLKMIIAPDFDDEAISILNKTKLLKINTPYQNILKFNPEEIKLTPFGALIQEKNTKDFDKATFNVITKNKPSQSTAEDMIFAFKVVKHIKSSAIVIAKDLRTIGICASETNRARCAEIAISKVCDSVKDAVLASDGAITSIDIVQIATQNRITGIIQPGGSKKDAQIAQSAEKFGIAMISTGIRHYKH